MFAIGWRRNQFADRGKSSVAGWVIIVRYVTPLRTAERDG
jgi:hypothetical protein